jgi:transposase
MIANRKKIMTVNNLMAENIRRQTVYNIIHKYETSDFVGDKPRSGGPREISAGQRTRLKRLVNHHTGISLRKVARKFNVHRRTIQRELNRMGIQYRKKKKAPRYTKKQLER